MITQVKLVNWRSHADTELEFSRGTNVLVGNMGSGKSSVMDAICFALFGTFPALAAKKTSVDACIMNTPEQKQSARVEVALKSNGKEYTIVREVELGKGTKAEIRENNVLLEGPQTKRVTEVVEEKLGVNYELFSRAVYSEQNQMDYFLQLRAGERKKKIDELLQLERFENARKNLTTLSNRLRDRKNDIEKLLEESSVEKVVEEKAREENILKELEENARKAEEELVRIAAKKESVERELGRLEENEKKAREIKEKITVTSTRLEACIARAKGIEGKLGPALAADLTKQENENAEKRKAIEKAVEELEVVGKELAEIKARLNAGKQREAELTKKEGKRQEILKKRRELEAEKPGEKLAEAKGEAVRLEQELAQARAEVEMYEKRLKELGDAGDNCPVCESEITADKKSGLVEEAKKKLGLVRNKVGETKRLVKEKNIQALEERVTEFERLQMLSEDSGAEVLEVVREENVELEKKMSELEAKYDNEEKKRLLAERDKLVATHEKIARINDMREEHRKLAEEIKAKGIELERVKQEANALEFDEDRLVRVRQEARELAVRDSGLREKVNSGKEIVQGKQRMLEQFDNRLKEVEERSKEVGVMKTAGEELGVMGGALEHTQSQLREEFAVAINAGLEDIWPRVYPYEDYSSCRLAANEQGYVLQLLRRSGDWVDVEGVASGGERSTAALSLRIAFSLVLTQNLSWLVLDEPTHNLDTQGVQLLSTALREHLPELVDQVFIITHDEEMEQAGTGAMYRFERDKAAGEPTRTVMVEGKIHGS